MNRLIAVLCVSMLALAGCSGDSGTSPNEADVTFAQEMIPHHRQATEMAQLAADRTTNPDILDLADDILAAQEPEIVTMTGWLEDWDEDVPAEGSMSDMAGMAGEDDLAVLRNASGAAFDRQFLTLMIAHHEGALDMAATEIDDGQYPQAIDLATKIRADQTRELDTMKDLLDP